MGIDIIALVFVYLFSFYLIFPKVISALKVDIDLKENREEYL